MRKLLPLRVLTLLRKEFLEYKTLLLLGPIFLALVGLVSVFFAAIFADKMGTFFGGAALGDVLKGLEVHSLERKVDRQIHFTVSGEGAEYGFESFESQIEKNSTQGTVIDILESNEADGKNRNFAINEILYSLHKLLMLVPFFIAIKYLLGSFLYDRLDGSYLFWRSMPVSASEEVITKISVALFLIPLTYLAVSFLIQTFGLLIFLFPIYRIGFNPISVISDNFDLIGWCLSLLTDWFNRGFLCAPIFSWVLLASTLAYRSSLFIAILPLLVIFVFERFFWGTYSVLHLVTKYLPQPLAIRNEDFNDPISTVLGVLFSLALLSFATYFRRSPLYVSN